MQDSRAIRIAFVISLVGHCLFLGMPGTTILSHQHREPKDVVVRIEVEKPTLLPKIDVMGEEKKLREIIKEEELSEIEPEEQIEEVMVEKPEPPKEIVDHVRNFISNDRKDGISNGVEVINPQEEAMLRYQDMIKQKIESCRRYPNWAKKQGFEDSVYLTFIVLFSGQARDIKIIHSSGFAILDNEAVATIRRASPFLPIPKKFNRSQFKMEVAVVFKLK